MAKYVPISSVLYDLSLSMDPSEWNTSSATEWAIKASRKMGGLSLFKTEIKFFLVTDHTLKVPTSVRTINQIIVNRLSLTQSNVDNISLLEKIHRVADHPHPQLFLDTIDSVDASLHNKKYPYRPVYKSTGHFINACNYENMTNCVPEYREEPNLLRFSFKEGIVAINYLAYATDGADYLIPDIEDYKEAIRYYILYRIYEYKCHGEQTQFNINERDRNAKLYSNMATRAVGKVNESMITTDIMENIKNMRSRMIPKSNNWEQGFSNMGHPESGRLF